MPYGDGTGPGGYGPMTGRAMGYCAGYDRPGFMNPGPGFGGGRRFRWRGGFGRRGWGRGFGRGPGGGFGWRRPDFVPAYEPAYGEPYKPTKQEESKMLEDEAKAIEEEQKALKQELEEIKKRIEELSKKK